MFRRLTIAAALLATAASLTPAAHAAPKTSKLYLINVGEPVPEGCTQSFVLSLVAQDNNECSGALVGYEGTGFIPESPDTFTSLRKYKFKVDTTRNLTGTLYFHHLAYIGLLTAQGSLPGYVEAEVVVKMDGVRVGTVPVEGVEQPKEGLKVNLNMRLPASLRNKTVSKIVITVQYKTVVGLNGVSFTAPYASFISVPVK